jgi:hypothetical protein
MEALLIILYGLAHAGVLHYVVRWRLDESARHLRRVLRSATAELANKSDLETQLLDLYGQLLEFGDLANQVTELTKTKKRLADLDARFTQTQQKLDVAENRLRDLDEIDMELRNCAVELEEIEEKAAKKSADFRNKNQTLKTTLELVFSDAQPMLEEDGAPQQFRDTLHKFQESSPKLFGQFNIILDEVAGQYDAFLKFRKRYDALDIEYALLVSKVEEMEAAQKEAEKQGEKDKKKKKK